MSGIDEITLNFSPASLTLLNAILAIVMFSIAIDLTPRDFDRLRRAPKPVIVGLVSQFLVLPALTFALVWVTAPRPSIALGLILATTAVIITLAAQAALAANGQVIQVLRLVGARDTYIARAFVRRFTVRAFVGAIAGAIAGMIAIAFLPAPSVEGGFLTGLGFQGFQWLVPLVLPPIAGFTAFWATRRAALQTLRAMP